MNNWNGVGLPPVGAECEFFWESTGNIWVKGAIAAIVTEAGIESAVIQLDGCYRVSPDPHVFRPIKSEREKAIEEMYSTLENTASMSYKQVAEKLYDAGYRKQESEK